MHLKLRKEKGHSDLGSGSLPHLDDHCSCEVIRALSWGGGGGVGGCGKGGEDVEWERGLRAQP